MELSYETTDKELKKAAKDFDDAKVEILDGPTDTGKTTFTELVLDVLGDYGWLKDDAQKKSTTQ